MKEKRNKKKKFLVGLLILLAAAAFSVAIVLLKKQPVDWPLEYLDESYQVEYGPRAGVAWTDEDTLYAVNETVSAHWSRPYSEELERAQVERLLSSLELQKKNSGGKLKAGYEENGETIPSEIENKKCFLIYGKETWDGILLVTEDGEIYVKGYRYIGNTKNFQKAFSKCIKELVSAKVKEDEKFHKEFFLKGLEDINWE